MSTTYTTLRANLKKAIRNHLMDVDALPPTMALAELANEITDVVFAEMDNVGLTKDAIDGGASVEHARTQMARSAA